MSKYNSTGKQPFSGAENIKIPTKMKTRKLTLTVMIIATLSLMAFSGCKKKDQITPICCPWAPEIYSISRTDYNSPAELTNYFREYDSTRLSHDGDTLKVWGWVYYHGPEEPIFEADYSSSPLREVWTPEAGYILLVSNEDHHGYGQHIRIDWNKSFLQDHPEFVQGFDSYLQKKWYVTIKVECVEQVTIWEPCRTIGHKYHLINMDTIPNN